MQACKRPRRGPASCPPPPPPPKVDALSCCQDGQTFGPYAQHVLAQQAVDGGFTTAFPQAWTAELEGWQAAGEVQSAEGPYKDFFDSIY